MYTIILKDSNHTWIKKNLITITTGPGRSHDEMYCEKCGIKGKRYNLAELEVDKRYKKEKVLSCPYAALDAIPKIIKVTECRAYGSTFANIKNGNEYEVVTPPDGFANDSSGVWVMGVGEPVKLLANEYVKIQ
ncbi:MAG: hypothetical protein J6N72_10460 [Psychrobacter sp.]|nr:hypothetical protein [Psychrobacter sp.]